MIDDNVDDDMLMALWVLPHCHADYIFDEAINVRLRLLTEVVRLRRSIPVAHFMSTICENYSAKNCL